MNSRTTQLNNLIKQFPKQIGSYATTGYIPIGWAEANQKLLKKIVKENGLRRVYRGPRVGYSNFTLKANAYAIVLYVI